jgi:hypothetical protein
MKRQRRVVLVGESLLMDAVETSLRAMQGLHVMRTRATAGDVGERLRMLRPDLVIFDWDAPHSQFVLPFIREQPDIPLLALDIHCSKVITLSGQQFSTPSMNALTQVIDRQTSRPTEQVCWQGNGNGNGHDRKNNGHGNNGNGFRMQARSMQPLAVGEGA